MTASATRDISGNHGVYSVEIWTRKTLADGSQMYNGCINPICDAIEDAGSGISELSGALDDEVDRAINAESALSADITAEENRAKSAEGVLSSAISAETARAISAETVLQTNINNEATARNDADQKLQQQIDTLEAATDVIDVFSTYSGYSGSFTNMSSTLFGPKEHITENDVIKILNDNSDTGEGGQTYWQATDVDYTTSSCTWTNIGKLDPYYSKAEINGMSSLIADTYLSATAVKAGDNIKVTKTDGNPEITISTNEDVVLRNISATAKITADTAIFTSGKINTGNILTAYGSSAKFDNISASGISSNSAIINTISGNSAHFNEIDISAIDLDNIIAKNISATSSFSGKDLTISNSAKIVGISSTNVSSTNISANSANFINVSSSNLSANSAILASASGISAKFDNISGKNVTVDYITAINVTASNNFSGKNLTIDESAKIVGISSTDVSSTNISALSLTANTASGQSANFDDISGKNISANIISGTNVTGTNIDGNKLTVNTSAKIVGISATNVSSTSITANSLTANTATGNSAKFTDISATNITGINLSSTNISAKNISGLENITAKSGYFTDISATNNISAESATIVNVSADILSASNIHSNISSFFRDVSAKNLTAEFGRIPNFSTDDITADSSISSPNITADNITGTNAVITNITGDSGYFTDIGGETLHGVTSSIDVDELISAVSSISGESNLYVRKDELECEIGTDNSATNHSFAQGSANKANNVSLVQGDSNSAYSKSFAQGKSNSANENSFAQGVSSTAYDNSFAQGYSNSADKKSFAQGDSNTAYFDSLAQGEVNRVSNYSIGQGQANSATNYSIAQGYHNNASNTAQAFGYNLVIESAMAIGKFNKTSSDAVFVIGNGTADNARNDLMVVDNSAAITLINYPYNDNQVDKIIISTTGVSGMYDHSHGGIASTGEYSSEWSNLCNIDNKYVPLSAQKCVIGSNNTVSDNDLVFIQGMSNYAYVNSLAQGTNNSAITNSLAQGHHNSAEYNSIAVGMNNTAYLQSQAFGSNAFASAGMAINPNIWGTNNPTCAFANGFAMGKDCLASGNSFAFGFQTSANENSMAHGYNTKSFGNSYAFGPGVVASNGQFGVGKWPTISQPNNVFFVGNGSESLRRNLLTLSQYGTLTLYDSMIPDTNNKVLTLNGSAGYIRSDKYHTNIHMMLTSGYGGMASTVPNATLITASNVKTQNIILFGNDTEFMTMWVPTGTSANSFKIMKAESQGAGVFKMAVGVESGYTMIFKNFASGHPVGSQTATRFITTGTTPNIAWPQGVAGIGIDSNIKSIYYPAVTSNTYFIFQQIPSNDTIDVIVDSFSKQFIMIKNHSEV